MARSGRQDDRLAINRTWGGASLVVSQRGVRVVVGEGQSTRRGLLRFVLEGEGYQVVGQATTSADLARVLAIEKPDAVILDDGIGATAVQVAREASPTSKVVLVWPAGVVPVGGDARVEPGQVMRQLGPAVAALTVGLAPRQEGALKQPEWVARVRKGPSALRERLARAKLAGAAAAAAAAPLVILPGEAAAAAEPTLVLTDQGAAAARRRSRSGGNRCRCGCCREGARAVAPGPDLAARNQALGNLALGGAAVVGALALSLAIVGGRMPTDVVDVSGPTLAPSTGTPPPIAPTPSPSASVSTWDGRPIGHGRRIDRRRDADRRWVHRWADGRGDGHPDEPAADLVVLEPHAPAQLSAVSHGLVPDGTSLAHLPPVTVGPGPGRRPSASSRSWPSGTTAARRHGDHHHKR